LLVLNTLLEIENLGPTVGGASFATTCVALDYCRKLAFVCEFSIQLKLDGTLVANLVYATCWKCKHFMAVSSVLLLLLSEDMIRKLERAETISYQSIGSPTPEKLYYH